MSSKGVLSRLEQGVPVARKRKRQRDNSDDLKAAEFESGPRAANWSREDEESEENMHYLLPLRSKYSLIQQPAVPKPTNAALSEEEEEVTAATAAPAVMSAAALLVRREEKLEARKVAIADVASRLVESPEENVREYSLVSGSPPPFPSSIDHCVCSPRGSSAVVLSPLRLRY